MYASMASSGCMAAYWSPNRLVVKVLVMLSIAGCFSPDAGYSIWMSISSESVPPSASAYLSDDPMVFVLNPSVHETVAHKAHAAEAAAKMNLFIVVFFKIWNPFQQFPII